MADAEEAFGAKRDQLQGLIMAAKDAEGVDADALAKAKENFTKGVWFVRYADGGGDFPGMKIAHNPKGEIDYVERAHGADGRGHRAPLLRRRQAGGASPCGGSLPWGRPCVGARSAFLWVILTVN